MLEEGCGERPRCIASEICARPRVELEERKPAACCAHLEVGITDSRKAREKRFESCLMVRLQLGACSSFCLVFAHLGPNVRLLAIRVLHEQCAQNLALTDQERSRGFDSALY